MVRSQQQLYNLHFQFFAASLWFPHTCSAMFLLYCIWACADWHTWTTMPVKAQIHKDFLCLWTIVINFYIWYPRHVYRLSISGMNYIVPCSTNVHQPYKGFKRMAVSHAIPPLGIIPTVSGFRNIVRNSLLQIDDIVIDCLIGSIFTNFKNKFLNAQHACLSTLTSTML